MELSIFKSAMWQLVQQMDFLAILILVSLFCLSIVCVAVIAFKAITFCKHKKQFKTLSQRVRHIKSLSDVVTIGKEINTGLGGGLIMQILDNVHTLSKNNAPLSKSEYEQLEVQANQTIENMLHNEEMYLPLLSTSSAVGPLIGLFGTIWGLIHAFVDISQEKSADIATVAPGMAEALIVTLAGLIVAIPAMIAFHYFSNELRKFEYHMYAITDKILSIVHESCVK